MTDPNLTQPDSPNSATPLKSLIGSVISAGLAIASYSLWSAIAFNFATKPIHSDNQLTIRIASTVRTLVLGVVTLGTGVLVMITLGLFALAVQLLLVQLKPKN